MSVPTSSAVRRASSPGPSPRTALGSRDGLGLADIRHLYYYANRTIDGRIALGGRGAPYRLSNPISPANERDAGVYERLCATLREAFPAAAQARITHHWG